MSKNIKIIEELYRSFENRDYEAFNNICDKNIKWNQNPGFPKGGSHTGSEEVIENVFKSFSSDWEDWKFEIESYHDAGETIIVTGVYKGIFKKTGKPFVSQAAHFYTIKNEKVVSFQQYADTKVIWDVIE